MRCSLVFRDALLCFRAIRFGTLACVLAIAAHIQPLSAGAPIGDQPLLLWTDGATLNTQAQDALNVLSEAPQHGLPTERYALKTLSELAAQLAPTVTDKSAAGEPGTTSSAANADSSAQLFNELLTAALETYAVDLLRGLQPSAFKDKRDPKHYAGSKQTVSAKLEASVLKGLHRAIATNRVQAFIRSLEPDHKNYAALQKALIVYRHIADTGGWPYLLPSAEGQILKPGDKNPEVPLLRRRLAKTNKEVILAPASDPEVYDDNLATALVKFQEQHGLKADGKVGKKTRAALNVSADERVRQIELNLDRYRLMPRVMPANHIWVNVPQYHLSLQLDRREVLDMRVVVGTKHTPTPMMHDRLDHIVFSPYWHLPHKIAVQEVLPKVKADLDYLAQEGLEVLEHNQVIDPARIDWQTLSAKNLNYRFRQRPGSNNSLGDVKFIFPNNYAVYLHDTNSKDLFDKSMRALSHGCVRLEAPDALATALLARERGWKRQKVSRAMASGEQKYVKLRQKVPVYLVYFTTTVKDGTVSFHDDIYGHDARHHQQRKAKLENSQHTRVAQVLARYSHRLVAKSNSQENDVQRSAIPFAQITQITQSGESGESGASALNDAPGSNRVGI